MERSNYKYEIALSYAHKNQNIADLVAYELTNIFSDVFFQDNKSKHELSHANNFKNKLQEIFKNSNYAVIIYSKEYKEAIFTWVELDEIITKKYDKGNNKFFIININDIDISDSPIKDLFYLNLNVNDNEITPEIESKIKEYAHQIKDRILLDSIECKKNENEYSVNIQTNFSNGNIEQWKQEYDWNILTRNYIDKGGRKLKKEYTWEQLWNYIKKDFLNIKKELNKERDIQRIINFNCHLCIAYKLGQVYGDLNKASGNRNLKLVSSNGFSNISFTFVKEKKNAKCEEFVKEYNGNNFKSSDIVFIISIKSQENANILEVVKNSMNSQGQDYSKIYLFQKVKKLETADEIEEITDYLYNCMKKYRKDSNERKGVIHLFLDTLAPLVFVLGVNSIVPGPIKIYEYIDSEVNYEMALYAHDREDEC